MGIESAIIVLAPLTWSMRGDWAHCICVLWPALACTAFLQLSNKPTLATTPRRSGLLTIGPRFGGAIDDAARYFKQACDQVGGDGGGGGALLGRQGVLLPVMSGAAGVPYW